MAGCHVSSGGGDGGEQVSLIDGEDGGSSVGVVQPRIMLRDCEQEVSVCEEPWLAAASHHGVEILHSFLCQLGVCTSGMPRSHHMAALVCAVFS